MSRQEELSASVAVVRSRLAAACTAAGRSVDEVCLVAVTKTRPAADVLALAELGVRDVAENRDQEARPKVAAVAAAGLAEAVTWHFVGGLQRNKCASVATYAAVVHTLDRPGVVTALDAAARRAGRRVDALVQVSLDGDPDRAGASPGEVPALAAAVAAASGLRLAGVMAVAPLGGNPRAAFDRLAEVAARLRADHPDARWMSAGMSGDLEAAVAAGATHVRVGTALLGARRPPVG